MPMTSPLRKSAGAEDPVMRSRPTTAAGAEAWAPHDLSQPGAGSSHHHDTGFDLGSPSSSLSLDNPTQHRNYTADHAGAGAGAGAGAAASNTRHPDQGIGHGAHLSHTSSHGSADHGANGPSDTGQEDEGEEDEEEGGALLQHNTSAAHPPSPTPDAAQHVDTHETQLPSPELESSAYSFEHLAPPALPGHPQSAPAPADLLIGPEAPFPTSLGLTLFGPEEPEHLAMNPGNTTLSPSIGSQGPWLPAEDDELDADGEEPPLPGPYGQVNPLSPENEHLAAFLWRWTRFSRGFPGIRLRAPREFAVVDELTARPPRSVHYRDLRGSSQDFQGLDWSKMGVTRAEARERRLRHYKNYVNRPDSDLWLPSRPDPVPNTENFFRFHRMDIRGNVHLTHFQLRSVLACPGRNQAFYPTHKSIQRHHQLTGQSQAFVTHDTPHIQVSTLDAKCGVMVAGTFGGEYCLRGLYTRDNKSGTRGVITTANSGITNHLQVHPSRTSDHPLAAFSSNDQVFRLMDVSTERFILSRPYAFPVNCSALSPDRRLRVMVGDSNDVLITCADTGEILQRLNGHRDFGFACDWSDNGWSVATAAQDRSVKIWDARRWTNSRGLSTPVTTIRSDMASVRGLRFSPTGSGPRVLAAAEEADFVSVIDARTFGSKQTFDFFGEIGGISFANEGQDLNVLSCDPYRGGLVQLQRCDFGSRSSHRLDDELGPNKGEEAHWPKRRRIYFDDMEPF